MQRFVVIGAGVSGTAAAKTLKNAGHETVILEARNRIGGRTHTVHGWVDFGVEAGAEFIHDPNAETAQLIGKLGLATVPWPKKADTLVEIHGNLLTMDAARAGYPKLDAVRAWDFIKPDSVPAFLPGGENLASYVRRVAGFDVEQIHYLRRMFANACGEDPEILDAEQCINDVKAYAGVDLKLLGGYDSLVNHLAHGLDIRREHNVHTIDATGSKVKVLAAARRGVTMSYNEVFEADGVIITVPVGVLKSGAIRFTRGMPEPQRQALATMIMAPLTKMTFAFDRPIVAEGRFNPEPIAIYCDGNPPTWWSPSYGRTDTKYHVWSAFFGGNWARELLALPQEEALRRGLGTLRKAVNDDALEPVKSKLVNWLGDPFALGGYSACLPGGANSRNLIGTPTPPLYWAGEAAGKTATVHEAYRTGIKAARQAMGQSGAILQP